MEQTIPTAEDLEAAFLQKIDMPKSDLPYEERIRQVMAVRNEWKLYARKCDATGESIISAYPPDSPYTVYKNKTWWGDSWSAQDYAKDFDFNRSFFDQFYELQLAVPREGTSVFECENCDYNSHVRQSRNCYLNSLAVNSEDICYCYWSSQVESSLDCCFHINGKSSLCYECIDYGTCYNCILLQEGYNCSDCFFSFQLRGCENCILCSNLSNKSYHIFNKPCSKEEFEKVKLEFLNGSYASFQKGREQWLAMKAQAIHRSTYLLNCENVTGDHFPKSKNCFDCFDGDENEDCVNAISLSHSKDVYSSYSTGWPPSEEIWECSMSRGCIDMAMCRYMFSSNDMRYCDSCQTCKNCIGCIGLRHKEYCILNKQYSKEEYEEIAPKVVAHMKSTGEWGKFWPYEHLPFAYNETAAHDYFPLTKEQAIAKGYRWRDIEEETLNVEKVIPAASLPDNVSDVPEDVLHWAIQCKDTGKPFKMIKQELDFYRSMNLPLPRVHPMERHKNRLLLRNPDKLWTRNCSKCQKSTQSSYAPDRPETVYCESCYLKEVY